MNGSQEASLSKPLSSQSQGIVLRWQEYTTEGKATDNNTYQFVPRTAGDGAAAALLLTNRGGGLVANKQVYVHDDRIAGDDSNSRSEYTASSGVKFSNDRWVLTEVLGI